MDLCYIVNKSLFGLFCKNVHISAKWVTFNKVAFLFVRTVARHRVMYPNIQDGVTPSRQTRRHVRGLVAVVRESASCRLRS